MIEREVSKFVVHTDIESTCTANISVGHIVKNDYTRSLKKQSRQPPVGCITRVLDSTLVVTKTKKHKNPAVIKN